MVPTSNDDRLVGRDSDLTRLGSLLTDVIERGFGGTVAIIGPVGIGKSALLNTASPMAQELGFVVQRVDADPLLQTRPLGLITELFGPLPDDSDRPANPDLGFETTPLGTAATLAFLDRVEHRLDQPLLIVVDDLEWVDRWSLLLLARLQTLSSDRPLVMLFGASKRTEDRPEVAELVAAASGVDRLRIDLEPLNLASSIELAHRHLGGQPGPGLRSLLGRLGGNPLLIVELAEAVRHRAHRLESGELDVNTEGVPPEMSAIVELKLGALSDQQRSVLRLAAILGPSFDVGDLAAVSETTPLRLQADLTALRGAGLLAGRTTRLAFAHELIREVVYDTIDETARRNLHRRVASQLSTSGADDMLVLYHLAAGSTRGDDRTAQRLLESATTIGSSDPRLALDLLDRASSVAGADDVQRRISWARARPLAWAGRLTEASELMHEAIEHTPGPEERSELRRVHAGMLMLANRGAEALAEINLAAEETNDPIAHARLVSEEALARLTLADPLTEATAERAIALGEASGDATSVVTAHSTMARRLSAQHRYRSGLEHTRRGVELAEADGTGEAHRMIPWFYQGTLLLDVEDGQAVSASIRSGRVRMQEIGNLWAEPFYCGLAASLALREGRFDEALAEASAGIALGTDSGTIAPVGWCHAIAAHVHLCRDDLALAGSQVDRANSLLEAGQAPLGIDFVFRARALLEEARGELDAALDILREGWEAFGAFGAHNCQPLLGPDLVRLAVTADREALVGDVLDELERAAHLPEAPNSFWAILLRAQGLALGDPDLLERAVSAYPHDRVLDRWLSELDRADLLARRGRSDEASAVSEALLAPLGEAEATGLMKRARALLPAQADEKGAASPSDSPDSWQTLTRAEREVVELVGGGATNVEISRARGTSVRTVETQIHRAYQKLGLSSRTRLALEVSRKLSP